ncbi:MAG: 4Fe-4S dicluster domain-containing protein [Holophagales bacterium]|nr:MAG: 4Fe-4S dicluster domain-containing protein [Holophagales bacterium]
MFQLSRSDLDTLLTLLRQRGYAVVGPTVRDRAVVYDEIESTRDLPEGWTDEQSAGRYRLAHGSNRALFGYVVGPHSWKRFLHPPALRLWRAKRSDRGDRGTVFEGEERTPRRFAFFGVRPCEIAAIARQDRVFLGGPFVEPTYRGNREGLFVVAVHCTEPKGSCFCASMGTGPRAGGGFDIALTELLSDGREPTYLAEPGSDRGAELLAELSPAEASAELCARAEDEVSRASERMGRSLATDGLKEVLERSYESPRWAEVAKRCLSCANCTMVCPTCFCANVEDTTDLAGATAERWRRWDSCFTTDFSYLHGGAVRFSPESRYRQWLVHKLGTWFDQFGTSGCVGCGRCITWCPAAIDITEEARALQTADAKRRPRALGGESA